MSSIDDKFIAAFLSVAKKPDWRRGVMNALHGFLPLERMCIVNRLNESCIGWKYLLDIPSNGCALVIGDALGTISLNLSKSFKWIAVVNYTSQRNHFANFRKSVLNINNISLLKAEVNSNIPFAACSFKAVVLTSEFNYVDNYSQNTILSEVNRVLSDDGTFILFAENKWSYIRLKGILDRTTTQNKHPLNTYSHKGYINIIHKSGFKHIQSFKMVPDQNCCREIEPIVKTITFHNINTTNYKNRLKYSSFFTPSLLFLGSKRQPIQNFIENILNNTRINVKPSPSNKLAIKNYFLTFKGNVILRCHEKKGGERGFIIKIPINTSANKHNKCNYSAIKKIHSSDSIPLRIKSLIPFPLFYTSYNGQPYFVESAIYGISANSHAMCLHNIDSILKDAAEFLKIFHSSLCSFKEFDSEIIDRLINKKIQRLKAEFQTDEFDKIGIFLGKSLYGRRLPLACKHGDFCLPNLIIEENSCRLKGIIDWDNSRNEEIPIVDLLSLLNSRYSLNGMNDIGVKMIEIFIPGAFNPYENYLIEDYLKHLSIAKDCFLPLSIFFWIDHICSQVEYEFIGLNSEWTEKNILNVVHYINNEILR